MGNSPIKFSPSKLSKSDIDLQKMHDVTSSSIACFTVKAVSPKKTYLVVGRFDGTATIYGQFGFRALLPFPGQLFPSCAKRQSPQLTRLVALHTFGVDGSLRVIGVYGKGLCSWVVRDDAAGRSEVEYVHRFESMQDQDSIGANLQDFEPLVGIGPNEKLVTSCLLASFRSRFLLLGSTRGQMLSFDLENRRLSAYRLNAADLDLNAKGVSPGINAIDQLNHVPPSQLPGPLLLAIGNALVSWCLEELKVVCRFYWPGCSKEGSESNNSTLTCVAWEPTGKKLAAGFTDGLIRVWNHVNGQQPVKTIDLRPLAAALCASSDESHSTDMYNVRKLVWKPGRLLVGCTGRGPGPMHVWLLKGEHFSQSLLTASPPTTSPSTAPSSLAPSSESECKIASAAADNVGSELQNDSADSISQPEAMSMLDQDHQKTEEPLSLSDWLDSSSAVQDAQPKVLPSEAAPISPSLSAVSPSLAGSALSSSEGITKTPLSPLPPAATPISPSLSAVSPSLGGSSNEGTATTPLSPLPPVAIPISPAASPVSPLQSSVSPLLAGATLSPSEGTTPLSPLPPTVTLVPLSSPVVNYNAVQNTEIKPVQKQDGGTGWGGQKQGCKHESSQQEEGKEVIKQGIGVEGSGQDERCTSLGVLSRDGKEWIFGVGLLHGAPQDGIKEFDVIAWAPTDVGDHDSNQVQGNASRGRAEALRSWVGVAWNDLTVMEVCSSEGWNSLADGKEGLDEGLWELHTRLARQVQKGSKWPLTGKVGSATESDRAGLVLDVLGNGSPSVILTGHADGAVRVWLHGLEERQGLEGLVMPPVLVASSTFDELNTSDHVKAPQRKVTALRMNVGLVFIGFQDGAVEVWQLERNESVQRAEASKTGLMLQQSSVSGWLLSQQGATYQLSSSPIVCLEYSSDKHLLAVGQSNGFAHLLNVNTRNIVPFPPSSTGGSTDGSVTALLLSLESLPSRKTKLSLHLYVGYSSGGIRCFSPEGGGSPLFVTSPSGCGPIKLLAVVDGCTTQPPSQTKVPWLVGAAPGSIRVATLASHKQPLKIVHALSTSRLGSTFAILQLRCQGQRSFRTEGPDSGKEYIEDVLLVGHTASKIGQHGARLQIVALPSLQSIASFPLPSTEHLSFGQDGTVIGIASSDFFAATVVPAFQPSLTLRTPLPFFIESQQQLNSSASDLETSASSSRLSSTRNSLFTRFAKAVTTMTSSSVVSAKHKKDSQQAARLLALLSKPALPPGDLEDSNEELSMFVEKDRGSPLPKLVVETKEERTRQDLFGHARSNPGDNKCDPKTKKQSAAANSSQVADALFKARSKLEQNVEKVKEMEDKSEQMANHAQDFFAAAKQLRKRQQKSFFGW